MKISAKALLTSFIELGFWGVSAVVLTISISLFAFADIPASAPPLGYAPGIESDLIRTLGQSAPFIAFTTILVKWYHDHIERQMAAHSADMATLIAAGQRKEEAYEALVESIIKTQEANEQKMSEALLRLAASTEAVGEGLGKLSEGLRDVYRAGANKANN